MFPCRTPSRQLRQGLGVGVAVVPAESARMAGSCILSFVQAMLPDEPLLALLVHKQTHQVCRGCRCEQV